MSTNSQQDDRNSTNADIDDLARGLDGSRQQQAHAIADFVDGRIKEAIKDFVERLQALEAGTPGRAEAAQAVRAADQDPSPENVVRAEAALEHAEAGGVNDAPVPVQPRSGNVPPRRSASQPTPPDGRSLAGAHARLDQLETRVGEVQVVSATAYASVRADGGSPWRRAARWALAAFVVTFLVYGAVVMFDNRHWDWNWAIGLPAIIVGIAAALVFARSPEENGSTEAFAAADAISARWHQNAAAPAEQMQPVHGAPVQQNVVTAHAGTRVQ